jgi:uncharacterized damage-inducible protein DinB
MEFWVKVTLHSSQWTCGIAPARSAAELIAGLNATWQMMANALTSFTQASLDDVIEHTTRSGEARRFTRQWVIWHVIEHDLHDGGELSLLLGTHGFTEITSLVPVKDSTGRGGSMQLC